MCVHVIGVVRSATRLEALTYEAGEPLDRRHPWRLEHQCALRPFAPASQPELAKAWRALASAARWDETTLAHVLTVLRNTVPAMDSLGDLPALGPEVHPPEPPRATAAHPRAYRGTKKRPPRPQQPEAVDVRPYLLTRRHTDRVLELLGQPRGTDPYVAWNHRVDATASFEPWFVMQLLPLLRTCAWSDIGAFATLARSLELGVQSELRAVLVGVFLAAGDAKRALGWWTHVLAQVPEARLEYGKLVVASGVATLEPVDPEVAAQIASLDTARQWAFHRGLVGGASSSYLWSASRLGALAADVDSHIPPGRLDVTSSVETTLAHLGEVLDGEGGAAFWQWQLWLLLGNAPALVSFLASQDFTSLRPDAAFQLLRLADSVQWDSPTATTETWEEVVRLVRLLAEFGVQVSTEYQRQFLEHMCNVYWWATCNEERPAMALAKCLDICRRLAQPPFATAARLRHVVPFFGLIFERSAESWDLRKALCEAPDSSWLTLEDACKRENQARNLSRGLNRMTQFALRLMVESFSTAPGALLQTSELLASIAFEEAETILAAHMESPLEKVDLGSASIEQLCELIAPVAKAGGPNPVRRALRRHLVGEEMLADAQLRGHRDRIVGEFSVVRLAAVRQAVERTLAMRLGIHKLETNAVRHAASILGEADVNRRSLRRMLTANVAGDLEWSLRHPRTQHWFARHPKLDRDAWLRGVEARGEIEGIGLVRIAIERNPLEALKLGTYVDSCLGRGGGYSYSAAAVVLDANKQVVYARDARGSVVGRQLIAVSETDELVFFSVYGAARAELEPLFRAYDHALAAKLGLAIYGGSAQSYEIASILSHRWADDGAWEAVGTALP